MKLSTEITKTGYYYWCPHYWAEKEEDVKNPECWFMMNLSKNTDKKGLFYGPITPPVSEDFSKLIIKKEEKVIKPTAKKTTRKRTKKDA